MDKPVIAYPCEWEYRVVGTEAIAVRSAVSGILMGKEFTIEVSNTSMKGTYTSFVVKTMVASEESRVAIFHQLSRHPAIKIVL